MALYPNTIIANGSTQDFYNPFPSAPKAVTVNGSGVGFSMNANGTVHLTALPALNDILVLVPSEADIAASSGALPVSTGVRAAANGSATTSATGANFVALAAQECTKVTISNGSGTPIEVQQDGAGAAFYMAAGLSYTFMGIANAAELAVRRVDQSNTQVAASYRWER